MPGVPFTKDDPRINRDGRPVGARSFTTKVKEALAKIAEGKNYTYEEAFIKAILKKSIIDQDVGMMRTVWEQLDGKPMQRQEIDHTSKGERLFTILPEVAKQNDIIDKGTSGDSTR